MRKAVIVIPTYNEKGNIERVIAALFEKAKTIPNWEIHILVVDSFSPDETGKIVIQLQKKHNNLHILEVEKSGLGNAYINGFQYALDKINPYLLFEMDADLSHDPDIIDDFLKKIEQGADFVIGSRYIKGGEIPKNWGLHRKLLSFIGNIIVRLGFMKLKIADWTSGYRAIKSWIIKDAYSHIRNYSGYVFQVALLDYAVTHKAHVDEVPLRFIDRTIGESKINAIQYSSNTLFYVFTHATFIKFVVVGLIGFGVDFGISYLLIERLRWRSWQATLLSTEIAIISNFLLNNFWAFSHKKLQNNRLTYIWSFLKFNLISSGSIIIQTIGIAVATSLFGQSLWYIYKILIITFVIIPYSYFFYNKFIWKEK